ncbi:MAG: hypothetical protein Q8M94_15440 [Ignavibacteria bacterium]|nr:hypothetical protein [Ignavibacteria bacterium]
MVKQLFSKKRRVVKLAFFVVFILIPNEMRNHKKFLPTKIGIEIMIIFFVIQSELSDLRSNENGNLFFQFI